MKNKYFNVNRRYIVPLVYVVLSFFVCTIVNAQTSTPTAQPTLPPNTNQGPLRGIMQFMFPAESEPVPQSEVPTATPGTGIPGTGTPTVTPIGGIPTSPGLIPTSIPIAIPAQCQTKLDRAMANMTIHESNISTIYIPTEMATGVSWEIVATLHYLETGGSLDPNYSVLTGARIGAIETVIDTDICEPGATNPLSQYTIKITSGANVGCGFDSVIKSSLYAATLFKDKYGMARTLNSRNNFDISTDRDFKLLVGALASYNGFTQGECEIDTSSLLYSGNRWSSTIPNRNQCKPKYAGEDHVYGLYCLTDYYTNMYFHYHFGGSVIPYDQQGRVGGITFIHGLQQKYVAQPPQPTPTPVSPVNGLRYYPQCNSQAYQQGAYWSNHTMLGCGTYCDFGCGISSAAMVFSNLGTSIKDPEQFLSAYTSPPYSSPDCNLRYAILSNMFEGNGIQTEDPIAWPLLQPLHSGVVKTLVDGYLTAGYSIFVYGKTWWTNGSSPHAVWIVGKNGNHYNVMDPYWGAPPDSNGPPFPIVPYSSSRYVDIQVWSILPVKTRP